MPRQLTLNRAERKEAILALVTNCAGWDEEDVQLLANMNDGKLMSHLQNCAQLTANADPEDDSGYSDRMKPESAGSHESDADEDGDEGWGSEVLDSAGSDDGEDGPEAGTDDTKKKDQPKVCYDDDGNEIACAEGTATGDNVQNTEQYLQSLPPAIRSVVTNALKFERAQKQQLIGKIVANRRNRFSERYLSRMGVDELEALAELASPPKAVYNGAQGGPVNNAAGGVDPDDLLIPPVLEFSRN
jgi:hypothetical protein